MALKSGIHPKESEIPLTFRIRDPSSTYKESTIQNPLRGIQKLGFLNCGNHYWSAFLLCGVGMAQFLFNRRLVVAPVRNTKKLN